MRRLLLIALLTVMLLHARRSTPMPQATPPASPDDHTPASTDIPDTVTAWRADRLEEAGYAPLIARLIAESRVDLHDACELAAKASPHLAARILL